MSPRQRKAIYQIGQAMAANPVNRLSFDEIRACAGKHATNILNALFARGIIAIDEASSSGRPPGDFNRWWQLTPKGQALYDAECARVERSSYRPERIR